METSKPSANGSVKKTKSFKARASAAQNAVGVLLSEDVPAGASLGVLFVLHMLLILTDTHGATAIAALLSWAHVALLIATVMTKPADAASAAVAASTVTADQSSLSSWNSWLGMDPEVEYRAMVARAKAQRQTNFTQFALYLAVSCLLGSYLGALFEGRDLVANICYCAMGIPLMQRHGTFALIALKLQPIIEKVAAKVGLAQGGTGAAQPPAPASAPAPEHKE